MLKSLCGRYFLLVFRGIGKKIILSELGPCFVVGFQWNRFWDWVANKKRLPVKKAFNNFSMVKP
jgi:hypothetical protein